MASKVLFGASIGSICPAPETVVVSAPKSSASSNPNLYGVFLSSVATITFEGALIFFAQIHLESDQREMC